jgi:excinuclease UvrABC nuclease subunit
MRKNEISFSLLESVPGIGPERSKKILRDFGKH